MGKVSEAFDSFQKKLSRAVRSAGGKSGPDLKIESESAGLQRKISDFDERRRQSVISRYRMFLEPSEAVAGDEESLLAAYNLHADILDANSRHGIGGTFIPEGAVVCPLCKNERYTSGGDFIYLQLWLLLEQKKGDFLPFLSEGADGTFSILFTESANYRFSVREKEILSVVKSVFY